MEKLPNQKGPVSVNISDHLDELFELDTATCKAAPNVLPLESKEELYDFLMVEHNTETFIWNDEEGTCVGYLSYIEEPDDEGRVELLNLIVSPSHWRKGIGSSMVSHYLDLMRSKGFNKSKLVTSPKNVEAINFYERLGYAKEAVLEDYYGPGEDRVLMVCDL